MNCYQGFSDVTKNYLYRFYEILENMIREMQCAELTDSLSATFIRQMIPHHEAAIKMSQNILQYTTLIPLQKIALHIIKEQTESIENMQNAFRSCCDVINSQKDLALYQRSFQQITQTMFCDMQNAHTSNNINANFMCEMIPHHEGAIRMSESILCYPICPVLVPILKAIITSQKRGVVKMRRLLQCT